MVTIKLPSIFFGGTYKVYPNVTLADAPAGLVQPFACSDARSEPTHGMRCWVTK